MKKPIEIDILFELIIMKIPLFLQINLQKILKIAPEGVLLYSLQIRLIG